MQKYIHRVSAYYLIQKLDSFRSNIIKSYIIFNKKSRQIIYLDDYTEECCALYSVVPYISIN